MHSNIMNKFSGFQMQTTILARVSDFTKYEKFLLELMYERFIGIICLIPCFTTSSLNNALENAIFE